MPIPHLSYRCTVCDRTFSTLKGLRIHASLKKHGKQDDVRVRSDIYGADSVMAGVGGDSEDAVRVVVDKDT